MAPARATSLKVAEAYRSELPAENPRDFSAGGCEQVM
jgi:hypothetical protein